MSGPKGYGFWTVYVWKRCKFSQIGLIKGVFFTLAWHWVLNTLKQHICQSIYYHPHNIRRIRKYLSYDNGKSIVQAIIMSRLDYCNGLLYGTPDVHLKLGKLQRQQNAVARLVCTVSRYDHITPSLINLHWLPVTHRIEFKIAMLVHKCTYGVSQHLTAYKSKRARSISWDHTGHTSNGQCLWNKKDTRG